MREYERETECFLKSKVDCQNTTGVQLAVDSTYHDSIPVISHTQHNTNVIRRYFEEGDVVL